MRRNFSLPAVQAALRPGVQAARHWDPVMALPAPVTRIAGGDLVPKRWIGLLLRKQEGLKGQSTGGGAEQTD
jgi:hypothetical protein